MTTEEIFNKAKEHGITKYDLGNALYKKTSFRAIYNLQIPTKKQERVLKRLSDALENLIKQKEAKSEN